MKNLKITIILLVGLFANLAYAASSDLLVSPSMNKKGSQSIAFEFVNEENVTSMQFDIEINGLNKLNNRSLDLSNCLGGLDDSNHQGGCKIVEGKLRVLIFSLSNTPIPSGTIGSVSFKRQFNKSKMSFSVDNMKMAAPHGVKPKGTALVDEISFSK